MLWRRARQAMSYELALSLEPTSCLHFTTQRLLPAVVYQEFPFEYGEVALWAWIGALP